jgi:hypothetical protein
MARLAYRTILLVDDDRAAGLILAEAIARAGGMPIICASAAEALLAIARTSISAAILGERLSVAHPRLRQHLIKRKIPYIWHRDLVELRGSGAPDSAAALVDRVAKLLNQRRVPR